MMISDIFRNSNRFSGFTLPELIVAITISSLVILGVTAFLSKINQSIADSVTHAKMYEDLTKFSEKVRDYRHVYPDTIAVDVSGGYDGIILTNSGRTSWVYVGVVSLTGSNATDAYLDPSSNYATYNLKSLAIAQINSSQISAVVASWATAASSIPFPPENQFSSMNVASFQIKPYNSNTIMEGAISLYDGYYPNLFGTPTASVPAGQFAVTFYF